MENNKEGKADVCTITMVLVYHDAFPPGSALNVRLNGTEEFEIEKGELLGPWTVVREVPLGSNATMDFYCTLTEDPDYGFLLFINNERVAILHERDNPHFIYNVDTSKPTAVVNFSFSYEQVKP
ncbi:MAG: hypothetical protein LIO85_04885 [Rikenellaceae bacterium]|nr:hypothetical protein [Rikenellaceae bacterium]